MEPNTISHDAVPPVKILLPPFPELEYHSPNRWDGQDNLPSWAGFQQRLGPYASMSSKSPSDGSVTVHVLSVEENALPSTEQVAAYRYLKENEEAVAASVLEAIWSFYETLPELYGFDKRETARHFRRTRRDGMRRLIGLSLVYVLVTSRDDFSYVGFQLGCNWDPEHALGVMTHKDRAVATGDATYSFEEWIARRDLPAGSGKHS